MIEVTLNPDAIGDEFRIEELRGGIRAAVSLLCTLAECCEGEIAEQIYGVTGRLEEVERGV